MEPSLGPKDLDKPETTGVPYLLHFNILTFFRQPLWLLLMMAVLLLLLIQELQA